MREIILDTETTGLSWADGDRVIELALIEVMDKNPTGEQKKWYFNPEKREVSEGAFKIHGISNQFLKDKPLFKDIAKEILEFISDSPLVAHNAPFDIAFLNAELARANMGPIMNKVIDTLTMARVKYPKERATLDALCDKFKIDLSSRDKGHEALVDCALLAQVYRCLTYDLLHEQSQMYYVSKAKGKVDFPHRTFPIHEQELQAHKEFVQKKIKNPIWQT